MKKQGNKQFPRPRFEADGSIVYPNRGPQPPNIQGYRRDPGNPYRFIKLWPECPKREEHFNQKPCGAIQIIPLCDHKDSTFYRKAVSVTACELCPLRQK